MSKAVLDEKLAKGLDKLDAKPAKAKTKTDKPVAKVQTKSKKAAEDEAEEDDPAPASVGNVWPFRAGSACRYVFRAAFEGVTLKAFAALFEKGGELYKAASHDFMLKVLRQGYAGKRGRHTHTWRLSEDGGRLKPFDVKYLGKPKTAAPAKGKSVEEPAKKTDKPTTKAKPAAAQAKKKKKK